MTKDEFVKIIKELGLTQEETAELLSVNPRTVRRWVSGDSPVPGASEQALIAWKKLKVLGAPWKPDLNNCSVNFLQKIKKNSFAVK